MLFRSATHDSQLTTHGSSSWTNDFPGMPAFFASQRRTFDPVKRTKDWALFQDFRYGKDKLQYLNQFERLVKRDRNHPSVFMWSIGNEEGWIHTTSYGKRITQTFIAKLKQLDPTRTCTYAADLPNVYRGVNEVIPIRGFNYRQFAVEDYHKDHPTQPILGTEMGSTVTTRGILEKDSIRGYLPDQDITAPWWASTAETWWKLAGPSDFCRF